MQTYNLTQIAITSFPLWRNMLNEILQGNGGLGFPKALNSRLENDDSNDWALSYLDRAEFRAQYEKLSGEVMENTDSAVPSLKFWQVTVVKLCDFLCLMTFGKSIFDLVARAQNDDDLALCQVVQIDKTTLYAIPFFRKRLARAQLCFDQPFLRKLSTAIKSPSLGSKIKHPMLLLFFAMLDDSNLLDMPLDDLFDLCELVGVYGAEHGIEDRDSLRKRRSYYLRNRGRQSTI